jgi:hypothetical protein
MARSKKIDWERFKDNECWKKMVEETIDCQMHDIDQAHGKRRKFEDRFVKKETIAYVVATLTFIILLIGVVSRVIG